MVTTAALTVDFEYFNHLPAYRAAEGTTEKNEVGLEGIDFLLDTFASFEAMSTFFVVSDIAVKNAKLLKEIADDHELASHSRTHPFLSELEREARLEEMLLSKQELEKHTGATVRGFRAPSFDVSSDHFELLNEAGYRYDASVIPCRKIPGWYGGRFSRIRPGTADCILDGAPASISVIPTSVMPYLRLPLSGTWLRFFGVQYALIGMSLLARQGIVPVLYVHPWEFVDLPPVEGVPKRVYFRTGEWMRNALKTIMRTSFEFSSVSRILREFS